MRALRTLLVPALFGLALLTIALVTRSGKLARENPGAPINSAMREAMNMMTLPIVDEGIVSQRYPKAEITPTGLRYLITQPGDGLTRPTRGQEVLVHYRGFFLDGTPLDDSYSKGQPFHLQAGQAQVIPGWDEAIMEMTKGEKRTLIIPYWLGYGEKGIKGHIPPEATLVFEVELVDVLPLRN
ncbi:FKBP-type peptidyl-prolyl cis-trans isomerase [Actomonas aquatica]|uniref:Peptidyl-prolyl cis-trans isomerase n=1 Tax=Actomonas aquatica TaxID=2866162 RepID=A0ABZ1C497_9BACT|nr:FKBP-type peptidyl-prolyl cis-trans isomerase [Opitutus sp. WL0086]WRQ86374.1 FKBP-type peptidyl-prolyl cis-trans isomerase [Opitutus sp. WL0086]